MTKTGIEIILMEAVGIEKALDRIQEAPTELNDRS
jgi:hypothetical protein